MSRRTVNRWIEAGNLVVIRLSAQAGSVRVAESDLRAFIDARRTRPSSPEHTLQED